MSHISGTSKPSTSTPRCILAEGKTAKGKVVGFDRILLEINPDRTPVQVLVSTKGISLRAHAVSFVVSEES